MRPRLILVNTTFCLFIFLCAASSYFFAQEVDHGSDASSIRALEHEWVEGQSRNDNRALDLIFDNALVYIEYGRLVTKGEYLSRIRLEAPSPQAIVMEPMTVRTFGSTAIVVGTYREKGMKDGKALLTRWRFVDSWVQENGRWMLVSAAATPLLHQQALSLQKKVRPPIHP
jgi:hypothetical protein